MWQAQNKQLCHNLTVGWVFKKKSKTTWYHMIYIRVYHIYWHIYCICNPVKTTLVVVRKKHVLRLYEIVFLKWRIPKTVGFNTNMIQYWMIWGPPGSRNTPSSAFAYFFSVISTCDGLTLDSSRTEGFPRRIECKLHWRRPATLQCVQ